ncbi:hypothetical protein HN358_03405 [Candidatus Uhrbacteria bacterium]|jgi:hypothetical protein|nr:hypothetical protein [Candidatus Uhrbacteria bacterium]MBT7717598.1 hypothetical protein [Candidatus Uhrbacteria bacterium]
MSTDSKTVLNALQALIETAAAGTNPRINAEYVEGMVRVKPDGTNRGSYVEGVNTLEATKRLLEQLGWTLVAHEDLPEGVAFPPASYFCAELPEGMTARTGMILYKDLSGEQKSQVQLVEGDHGPEMVLRWSGPLATTTQVWAIIGTDGWMLWSWYPAPLAPRYNGLFDALRTLFRGETIDHESMAKIEALPVKLLC